MNMAIKECFQRKKIDSCFDLKINVGILNISLLFEYKAATNCHYILNDNKAAILNYSAFELTNSKILHTGANSNHFLPKKFQKQFEREKQRFSSTILY